MTGEPVDVKCSGAAKVVFNTWLQWFLIKWVIYSISMVFKQLLNAQDNILKALNLFRRDKWSI